MLAIAVAFVVFCGEQPYTAERERMVREQIERRGVTTADVLRVLRTTPRHLFVPEGAPAIRLFRPGAAHRLQELRRCWARDGRERRAAESSHKVKEEPNLRVYEITNKRRKPYPSLATKVGLAKAVACLINSVSRMTYEVQYFIWAARNATSKIVSNEFG
jgi:hypothetical protein